LACQAADTTIYFSRHGPAYPGNRFVGFARTYYLAGVFHAPLPSLIITCMGRHFPAGFSY